MTETNIIRVIPCLDVHGGRVVKGVNFVDLRDAGDPAEMATLYEQEGADELVFLDITATTEARDTVIEAVRTTAKAISIPLTVGGGIRTVEDIRRLMDAGASKVGINSAAVETPSLIDEAASAFGSDSIVVAIDTGATTAGSGWEVLTHGGNTRTGKDAIVWAQECEQRGAGALLPTSLDRDGTLAGYDLESLKAITAIVTIPVIASGGAGELAHFADAVTIAHVDAVLAASLFHFGTFRVSEVKRYLEAQGIATSLDEA